MTDDQSNDSPMVDTTAAPSPSNPRGPVFARFAALTGFIGCAVLGVLLNRALEREAEVRSALSASEYQRVEAEARLSRTRMALETVTEERDESVRTLRSIRAALAEAEESRDDLRSTLRQTELARDSATRALSAARAEVSECGEALEQAASIARSHRDKLDEIASAIRIGMIGVTDIPAKGFIFGGGFDLESEYRKVVNEYNDLVGRFNAAVERSNDLGGSTQPSHQHLALLRQLEDRKRDPCRQAESRCDALS